MKTKSKKCVKKFHDYNPFDLFGDIPVTNDEVVLWCEVVAKIPRSSWRFDWYVRAWDVPEKIRAAKRLMPLDQYLDLADMKTGAVAPGKLPLMV